MVAAVTVKREGNEREKEVLVASREVEEKRRE